MTAGRVHVHISSSITEARYCQVWRSDSDGTIHAAVTLGGTELVFDDAATARQVAAECLKAADALDALPAPEPPAEVTS